MLGNNTKASILETLWTNDRLRVNQFSYMKATIDIQQKHAIIAP